MDFSLYHLAHDPFTALQEPTGLFLSQRQQEALQAIIYSIEGRQGFVAILGASGLGKTTVLRSYLERVDQKNRLKIIYLSCLELSFFNILKSICQKLEISFDANNVRDAIERISNALINEYIEGKNIVVVLDDVHKAIIPTLENLPLLSEIEIEKKKLLQIVLIGQPEFQRTVKRPELRELRRYLRLCIVLTPLTRPESVQYVQQRLARVAMQEEPIFTPRALQRLVRSAQGNPRRLDQLCGEVLVVGVLQRQQPITLRLVREVLRDFPRSRSLPLDLSGRRKFAVGALLLVLLFCGVLVAGWETQWSPLRSAFLAPLASRLQKAAIPSPVTPRERILPEETESATLAMADATGNTSHLSSAVPPVASHEAQALPTVALPQNAAPEVAIPLAAKELERAVESANQREEQRSVDDEADLADTYVLCVIPHTAGTRGKDIVRMDYRGQTKSSLIADGALNLSPVLSPDRTTLAYTSYRDGVPTIYLRDLRTDQEEPVLLRPGLALPNSWSPDGRYLALSKSTDGNSDIFLYDVQRRHVRRLTTHPDIDILPSFAPDSTRLVFTSKRDGTTQIYLTDVHGHPPVRLTTAGPYNTSAVWSPRSDTIAFIGRVQADQPLALYTMHADGTDLQRVTAAEVTDDTPTWAPNGRFLLYTRGQEQRLLRVDSQDEQILSGYGSVCQSPQWVWQRAR